MSRFTLQTSHLNQLNQQLALLMSRLDACCRSAVDPIERRRREVRASIAHYLLDKVLAEHAAADGGQSDFVAANLETRLRESQRRIDRLRAKLANIRPLQRPDFDHLPSSGSAIGDAVRDGFLHMGPSFP